MAVNVEVVNHVTTVEVVTGGFVTYGSGGGGDWSTINGKPSTFPPSDHDHLIEDITGLQEALDEAVAEDAVLLTGAQTISGVKTFSSSPVVPDGSWAIIKTTGLQAALDLKAPLASPAFTGTPTGITKTHVGLANVDNTTDANKPVSTATQTALNLKAPIASPTFTGTVSGITAAMVGLGSVNNTSDASKPISTSTQAALDLKAPLASPAFTGTPTGITKTHVGLGSVDNTADTAKPVSTAQQTALNLKANLASPTFTGTLTAVSIATTNLRVGTSTTSGYVLTADASGNATWQASAGGGGGGDVTTNTPQTISAVKTFTAIPVVPANSWAIGSTSGLQTALDAKAPLASPAFTGTPTGITKTHVGLGNVDNTADTAKPVSTAQQTALNLKANLASPTFTGTVVVPDASWTIAKTNGLQTALDAKAPLASPAFTGTPTGITKTHVGLSNVPNTDMSNASNLASGTVPIARIPTGGTSTTVSLGNHTHEISTLLDTGESGFLNEFMPSGYTILVIKADSLYGAADSWPGTRPGRADQYVHWVGDTDPGVLSADHDMWTAV